MNTAGKWLLYTLVGFALYKVASMKRPSQSILNYVKDIEKFGATPYQDAGGFWTIGYGHKIVPGDPYWPEGPIKEITRDQADILFKKDTAPAARAVNVYVQVPLSQNQYDALFSLVYNIGSGNFLSSTLLRKLNMTDYQGAADEFPKWRKSNGKILAGLETRRNQEREIFIA